MSDQKFKLSLGSQNELISSLKTQVLDDYQTSIVVMLKKYGYSYEKFIITLANAMKKNTKLVECTKESLMSAVLASAELGLDVGSEMGYSFLVPFRNKKNNNQYEAKFIIGYKGIIELMYRSSRVFKITCDVVYENDHFLLEKGMNENLEHTPLLIGDRGKRIGSYAVVHLDNGHKIVQWASADDIEKLKRFSYAKDLYLEANDPFSNMWKKAAIRQVIKYTPKEQIPVIGRIAEFDEKTLALGDGEIFPLPESERKEIEGKNTAFAGLLQKSDEGLERVVKNEKKES